MLTFLAAPTEAEEIKTVGGYDKAGLPGDLPGELTQDIQFRINDTPAFYADHMGMGKRPVAVIPVASVRKSQLKDLIYLLEHGNGLVHCSNAHGGKANPDLLIDFFHGRMDMAVRQNIQHCYTLRSNPVSVFPETLNHLLKTGRFV